MTDSAAMPAPARHLAEFPPFLRGFGFTTSPEQTVAFLAAVELLGPRGIDDVRRAAREAPGRLPCRRGLRHTRARKGESVDLRRALRTCAA